jgi:hypothetical protein
MNSLQSKFKGFSISASDSKNKSSEKSQLTSNPSQKKSLMIWKPLPKVYSGQNSKNLPKTQANMKKGSKSSQERSTKFTFLNSRNTKWTPLKRLWPLSKEQIACAHIRPGNSRDLPRISVHRRKWWHRSRHE